MKMTNERNRYSILDLKSFLIGILVCFCVMLSIGATDSGTYQISTGERMVLIVNTKTGEMWARTLEDQISSTYELGTPQKPRIEFKQVNIP